MVMVSPEELASKAFSKLLGVKEFWDRIFALGVDEAHLLYFWGALFRTVYCRIGFLRERLPMRCGRKTRLLALTATLREGAPMDCICKFLSLHPGKYHFIRRSNARPDIQIIFRNMRSGLKSINFPELDWVLTDGQKIIIFCATISLGFRVVCYLWRIAEALGFANRGERIRMYNALNWPSYNTETLGFLNNSPDAQITIATDTLSVGINSPAETHYFWVSCIA